MKLSEVKKKYRDQWIFARVIKADPETLMAQEVEVLAHSPNRLDTYDAMRHSQVKHVLHFYNGRIPKEGYAFVL